VELQGGRGASVLVSAAKRLGARRLDVYSAGEGMGRVVNASSGEPAEWWWRSSLVSAPREGERKGRGAGAGGWAQSLSILCLLLQLLNLILDYAFLSCVFLNDVKLFAKNDVKLGL
jgi:hypothetical protein